MNRPKILSVTLLAILLVLLLGLVVLNFENLVKGSDKSAPAGSRLVLRDNWQLQSSASVREGGAAISMPGYNAGDWYAITMPASVIAGLLQNNYFPFGDPFYGKNLELIDPTEFDVPWWYRTEFSLPASQNGQRVWLKLEGLNYRAEVWLNGIRISNSDNTAGPFRVFEFDITDSVNDTGPNALAVEVWRPQNPKEPGGDLAITFVDWNPEPPDQNMGILNDVVVSTSGPVIVRHPHVITEFDLPSLDVAHLTVVAELTNGSDSPVSGFLEGAIGPVTFSQNISLAAGETKQVTFANTDYPQLDLSNPAIWWPWPYGPPNLNTLTLTYTVDGQVSDSLTTQFGIRQITSELLDGHRVFSVNGQRIQIRGAAWTPDMFQRRPIDRIEAHFRYMRHLNLNTIRSEGKMEDEQFWQLADQSGLLVMIGWNCCDSWQSPGSWSEAQRTIAYESLKTQMRRLRSHPSMLVWLNASDMPPSNGVYEPWVGDPAVEQQFLKIERDLQWPNPILSSATDYPSYVQTEPTGVRMHGPYEWEPPIYWETDTNQSFGGAWGYATEINPGPAVPPYDSLIEFIPQEHLWPPDEYWNYHGGREGSPFNSVELFSTALNERYGPATGVVDYAYKAQLQAYESHRAMFEAYGRHKYTATGVIQWMLNNAWPGMIWHLYDYYLRPGGSYFGTKLALEPLHVQYSYRDQAITVVNSTLESYANLPVTAQVFNLDGTEMYSNTTTLSKVGPDAVVEAFTLPSISGLTTTYFLRLTLSDEAGQPLSLNTYWLSTKADTLNWAGSDWYVTPQSAYADLSGLATLKKVKLSLSEEIIDQADRRDHEVTVTNDSSVVAVGVHLKLTKGAAGPELLPILWQDNYFVLLPGESRTVSANYALADLGEASPVVEVEAFNNR